MCWYNSSSYKYSLFWVFFFFWLIINLLFWRTLLPIAGFIVIFSIFLDALGHYLLLTQVTQTNHKTGDNLMNCWPTDLLLKLVNSSTVTDCPLLWWILKRTVTHIFGELIRRCVQPASDNILLDWGKNNFRYSRAYIL